MNTPTTQPQPQPSRKIARLKRSLQRAHISQQRVAEAAGVTKPHVCHVFAGRYTSKNVLDTAQRLLAESKDAPR